MLTGDAAYCKDPSTGFGMGDAITQALLLEQPLSAALNGADWEDTLAKYQKHRDEALLPFYRMTLAFTQAAETPAESLAWLRAALSNPVLVRMLAARFPAALGAPGVLPPPTLERTAFLARQFGAAPAGAEAAR